MAAVEAATVAVAAMAASEEVTKTYNSKATAKNWAGLDSNQRRRKASRFTVCPVWPLRNLPVAASVDITRDLRVAKLILPRARRKTTRMHFVDLLTEKLCDRINRIASGSRVRSEHIGNGNASRV